MRKKRLLINTITALMNQAITLICGFILPRQILLAYGSETNGLVSSIIQFLGIITFLDMGIGAVVQSTLYKPISKKDNNEISKILKESKMFFNNIAKVLIVYTIILMVLYPFFISSTMKFYDVSFLIFVISISSITQYLFGIVNQLFLNANQKNYINLLLQSFCTIANTIICVILIKMDYSIIIVKLISSLVLIIRPILLYIYVKKKFNIDYNIESNEIKLKDKWSAAYQHIATTIVDKTDIVVLSALSTLKNVSIYSVYHLVVNGIYQAFNVLISGIQSFLGDLYAKDEFDKFKYAYMKFEKIVHYVTSIFFSCTIVLIIPFIKIYTKGINDTNYIQLLFSLVISVAFAFACFRSFYSVIIKSVGHYKQTQRGAINEAIINVMLSVLLVYKFGLVGVAIGSLVSMMYRTLYLTNYITKNIIKVKTQYVIKLYLIDIIIFLITILIGSKLSIVDYSYLSWTLLSIKVVIISLFTSFFCFILSDSKEIIKFIKTKKTKQSIK